MYLYLLDAYCVLWMDGPILIKKLYRGATNSPMFMVKVNNTGFFVYSIMSTQALPAPVVGVGMF